MRADNPLHLRVFLASPGDVAEERRIATEVLQGLPHAPMLENRLTVDVAAYDDPDAPVPMAAGESPQPSVTRYKGRPADCDLTVVILWGRLGTPLPGDVVREDGSRFESGTVWEVEDARAAGQEVWVYHRTEKPRTVIGDPEYDERLKQLEAVSRFFASFRAEDGSLRRGFNTYATPAEFRDLLSKHFQSFVRGRLGEATGGAPPVLIPPPRKRGYPLVGRDELVEELRQRVLRGEGPGLVFLPGVGKTAVALELLADRRRLLEQFEGILWADLGRQPEVFSQLRKWAGTLGLSDEQQAACASVADWQEAVRSAIGDRRLLVVLDDVWSERAAREFLDLGPGCVFVMTTRNMQVAADLLDQSQITTVEELDASDSLRLLGEIAPHAVALEKEAVRQLIAAVGGLPLALVLVGKYLKKASAGKAPDPDRVRAAFETLTEAGERHRLRQTECGEECPPTLAEILEVSVAALESEQARQALSALSIFRPKPNTISKELAREVCSASDKVLYQLSDYGLLEHHGGGSYTIHRVISDFARTRLPEEESRRLHRKAFDYYAERLAGGIEDDPGAYLTWYRYEQADWQSTKEAWLYHLAHTRDDRSAMLAFLRVWFDAFFWWGYYRRFPFCDRLIQDWRQRQVLEDTQRGLNLLASFQDAFPTGHVKRGRGDWQRVEQSLLGLRQLLALDREERSMESTDARRNRGYIDLFLAEARAYGRDDRTGALALYEAAHARFEADGDAVTAPWIWFYAGEYLLGAGDGRKAAEYAQRSLRGAGESKPLVERDPELLANDFRLLGDVALDAGDRAGASAHYCRATLYAFSFQGEPEPADAYTMQFYREITHRVVGRLIDLAGTDRTAALELGRSLGEFWQPYRELNPAAFCAATLEAALDGRDPAGLAAALFPPEVPDDDLVDRAAELSQQVRAVVPGLFRILDGDRSDAPPLQPSAPRTAALSRAEGW